MPNSNGFPWIVIGGSTGGVTAAQRLVSDLPRALNAAVFVVIHTSPCGIGLLPEILSSAGRLPARYPEEHELVRSGIIYVAPPNRHIEIDDGNVIQTTAPKENQPCHQSVVPKRPPSPTVRASLARFWCMRTQ